MLGYRLHGNLMALANGMPSIYFTYDSRTVEFVETFKIPAFDVFSGKKFELEDYWDQACSSASTAPTTAAIARCAPSSTRTASRTAWPATV